MSFASDIYTLMTSDSTLNAAVDGIYYQIVPDNPDLDEVNIVYTFSLTDSIDILEKNNEIDIYSLSVSIVAQDTAELDTVSGHVRTLLDNYDSTAFRDIKLETTEQELEGEREQFVKTLNYKIMYQN